jgi:biotin-dependent carboxylase-like uncharacterized protein
MKALTVLNAGVSTTVQDLGRYGYQQYGVPPSGALDSHAFRLGNLLLGNAESAASLEITLPGCRLQACRDTVIAITGADLGATVNGQPVPLWESLAIRRNDIIAFSRYRNGCRAYLAVAGGIDVPQVMESRSTYLRARLGGFQGRRLGEKDTVHANKATRHEAGRKIPAEYIPVYGARIELKVILGPQDDYFTEKGVRTFLASTYSVSAQSDRMGYRLEGPQIEQRTSADIVSDGIPLGAIQVPGDGLPIILLGDRQTTGGYTKIAVVSSVDIPKVAQAKPGDAIRFKAIPLSEARHELLDYEQRIHALKHALDAS